MRPFPKDTLYMYVYSSTIQTDNAVWGIGTDCLEEELLTGRHNTIIIIKLYYKN